MKQLLFRLLLTVFCLFGITYASGAGFVENGFSYTIISESDKTVELSGIEDLVGDVVIPKKTAQGYKVISIGAYAFNGSYVRTVVIPPSVASIKNNAFRSLGFLTSVTINGSVTSIGDSAFRDCKSLTTVTILGFVTSIGDSAFYGCSSLTTITIPGTVTSIGDSVFYDCSSLTTVAIPNSVTSIGREAFYGCSSLTTVAIPNSVTSIGYYAFYGCSSLTTVAIPNSVTSIGYCSFFCCSSLTTVTIPDSVTSIGGNGFSGCSSLTTVTIPNSVTSIGDRAFSGCEKLQNVVISDAIENIPDACFKDCPLEHIVFGRSLKSITGSAFGIYKGHGNLQERIKVKTIKCYAAIPPSAGLSGIYKPDCVLYVPVGSGYLYKVIPSWSEFGEIHETLEWSGIDGVNEESDTPEIVGAVDIQGRPVDKDASGLVILKYSDGSVKKVMNK